MARRFDAPGVQRKQDAGHRFAEKVELGDLGATGPRDQYLDHPELGRIGICCSGGGVRAASYALGALQVLRNRDVLHRATHLSSVSGGDYMTVAHAIMVSETLRQDTPPPASGKPPPASKEEAFFGELPPWGRLSPEEQHLRNHTTYLAPGIMGRAWMALNLVYGAVRHLIAFGAWITLLGTLLGLAFAHWIGPVLRTPLPAHGPAVRKVFIWEGWALVGLAVLIGLALMARQWAERHAASGQALRWLQRVASSPFELQVAVLLIGILLPTVLLALHDNNLLVNSPQGQLAAAGGAGAGSLGLAALLGHLAKRGLKSDRLKKVLPKLMPLAMNLLGPLVVAIPLAGVTYFITQKGVGSQVVVGIFGLEWTTWWWLLIGLIAVLLIAMFWLFLDEVTSNMHWFYRERLATAFVGLRRAGLAGDPSRFEWGEPDWKEPIKFSQLYHAYEATGPAKMPNLVVCAAVNVSDDVLPPGRLAGSFTFERDFSGGPLTGYLPTSLLEETAGKDVLTLPAMKAISGAAISPSMGKLTKPWARFLLALFNARLGVWLPNPLLIDAFVPEDMKPTTTSVSARRVRDLRRAGAAGPAAGEQRGPNGAKPGPPMPVHRPGSGYLLREAVGQNHLDRRYVYVTDGGHWDNLGLVELLRRGCGQILCFDAAGDDIDHFHTLSEAIELARSDLGVEIRIDLTGLRPKDVDGERFSDRPFAEGWFRYPDGTMGRLLFAKAALTEDMPQDARDWHERDKNFPSSPLVDQWFDDRQFESFRALGAHAARSVLCAFAEFDAMTQQEQLAYLEKRFDECLPDAPEATPAEPSAPA